MKTILGTLILSCLVIASGQNTFFQNEERDHFDKKLYSVVPLSHFGTGPKQFAALSPDDRASLLACHDVLSAFFRALDRGGDLSQFQSPELARKYANGEGLLGPEMSLMEIGVFDWNIRDTGKKLDLSFFALVFSDGEWVLSKNVATLERSGSSWHVVDLQWKQK